MWKRRVLIGIAMLLISDIYLNWDIYYIDKLHMYIKIENNNDTTTIYFSKSRFHLDDNYIKYLPQSAEMSNLGLNPIRDTLYAIEEFMEITEIHSKDYKIKQVSFIRSTTRLLDRLNFHKRKH